MKTYIEIVSELAEEEGLVHLSAEIKLKLDDEHLELLQKAADMYAEQSNSGEANMSVDLTCIHCGDKFDKVTELWSHLDTCRA